MAYYLGKNGGITDTLFNLLPKADLGIRPGVNAGETGGTNVSDLVGGLKTFNKCKACINDKLETRDMPGKSTPCPAGWVPAGSAPLPCEGDISGTQCESNCIKNFTDPAQRAACIKSCSGTVPACVNDSDCGAGQKCVDGKCTSVVTPPAGNCGIGIDKKGGGLRNITTDCPCGDGFYRANEADACPAGYRTLGTGEDARCECDSYVPPGDTTTTTMGEFTLPQNIQDLMSGLSTRAGEYLGKRPGYSDTILRTLLGQNYDAVRRAGTLTRNSALADLQTSGLLDTGAGAGQLAAGATATDQALADAKRNVIMANETKKTSDLSDFTKMASDLTGQQVGIQQVLEAINAARRGEGRSDLALMLQYLMSLMSSWKTA